jgi:DNA-binding beta-propeller fold protein YncE
LCVDDAGNVYVTDTANDRVLKYTWNGMLLSQVGSHGLGDGQFMHPVDVLKDPSGLLYVTDSSPRMQAFDATLAFVSKWSSSYPGGNRLAIDPGGQYIYFTSGYGVQQYTLNGQFVRSWATGDTVNSVLYGIAVGPSGAVYVGLRLNMV